MGALPVVNRWWGATDVAAVGENALYFPGVRPGDPFDIHDTFTPNYFGGLIDNLRIWNVVRSASQIKARMFQSFGASYSGLLAEWSFDGHADDPVGGHDGILVGQVDFRNGGGRRSNIVGHGPLWAGLCRLCDWTVWTGQGLFSPSPEFVDGDGSSAFGDETRWSDWQACWAEQGKGPDPGSPHPPCLCFVESLR